MKLTPSQAIATDDYAAFPAVAAALDQIEKARDSAQLSTARDALRKAELQRDIARGFCDLWSQFERDQAQALGLLS